MTRKMPVDQNSLAYRAFDRGCQDFKDNKPEICPEEFKATVEAQQSYHGGYDLGRDHEAEKGR